MFAPRFRRLALFVALVISTTVSGVQAYDLPSVNLGFTSFLDGTPPSGPGLYLSQYVQYYWSDRLNDDDGSELPISGTDLDVWASLTQILYQSDQEVFPGCRWGIDIIVPYASFDASYDTAGPEDNGSGLGDILVGPYLQWDPVMGEKGPRFIHRIELQMIFPTGEYDDDKELNPGSNFFSFNPYWSGTLFITPRWTVSTRVHYLWNAENNDPNRAYRLNYGASEVQAGQAVHLNFASAYEVVPRKLRLGVNGYYLKQLTNTEVDGDKISGTKERVFGIGPGALFSFSRETHLFFNLYFESEAENRPEGTRANVRFIHHF